MSHVPGIGRHPNYFLKLVGVDPTGPHFTDGAVLSNSQLKCPILVLHFAMGLIKLQRDLGIFKASFHHYLHQNKKKYHI